MKKLSRFDFILICKAVLCAVFAVVICLPCILMLVTGVKDERVYGESAVELSPFTVNNYLRGKTQSNFESWFSLHFPLRSKMVLLYNQTSKEIEDVKILPTVTLKPADPTTDPGGSTVTDDPAKLEFMWDTENNIYAEINIKRRDDVPIEPDGFTGTPAVLIGKSGYLFESAYINEFHGYSAPYNEVSDEGIVTLVDTLEYITEQLAARDITLVYCLSSSKASQYAEYIPDWYKLTQTTPEGFVRPYTRLQTELADSSVNYVDSSELFKEIGLYATFPKTGIHWNHLASFESTRAVISKFEEASGNTARHMQLLDVIKSSSPPGYGNSDMDVYNILYGALDKTDTIVDDEYYSPDIYIDNLDAERYGVLLQGGSFSGDIAFYLRQYRIVNTFKQFSYNTYLGSDDENPFGPNGVDAWDYLLEDIDLIIFEQTEQQIRGIMPSRSELQAATGNWYVGSNVIYASLYYYLLDHEIK